MPESSAIVPKVRNLASFDGGGIRGLIQLIILDNIMETIKTEHSLQVTPYPYQYFDLIGGTSTGGLNALLLGRLRMSTKEALELYPDFAQAVFGTPKTRLRLPIKGGMFTRYSAAAMENELKKIVQNKLKEEGGADSLMLDSREDACKTFVLATTAKNASASSGPRCIATYPPCVGTFFQPSIWEAARATSAAPMFFKSITIGQAGMTQEFIDGGLSANNPIEQVLDQAYEQFDPSDRISCILSIGTGKLKPAKYKPGYIPTSLVDTLIKISTNCEQIEQKVARQFESISNMYFRFNVEQGLQDVALDDWNRLGEVVTLTESYLREVDNLKKLRAVAKALHTPQGCVTISQLRPSVSTNGEQPKLSIIPEPVQPTRFYGREEVQAIIPRLDETLIASETKLENVQVSVIKLEERQLLDRLSNIERVKYNPGNICTPGTRVGILREVQIWASNFSPPLVASLRGKAGIGKSTVAHTVANSFSNMSCLAASYFFSRDVAMSRPLKNLLPELSRQLAFRIPSFRHALCAALESDDFPVFPQQQLLKLFIEPLRTSLAGLDHAITRPWIIVLDALDECEDDIRNCILLLTEALSEFQGKLKLIITSRPEAAVDAVQRLRQTRILNIDLASVENESDIRIYLELGLGSLRAQPGWPTVDPIQKLVMLAGGLFIWAAIVIEFLLESDTLSEEIELILNGTRWEDNPEKRLAQMYHIILEKAYLSGKREVHFRLFLPVLATVLVVSEPQSDLVIGHLAGDSDGVRYEHLRRILEGLSAVLHIPPDSPVVRTTHPSFYRYLTGDCKDDRFAVHSATHSRRLGQRCLTIISQKVHRDMCDIMGHAEVPHTRIADFRNRVSEYISQEVQYACKNWILHITAHPDIPIDSQTMRLLNEFFRLRLLPWIEVMAFLDSIDAARESLSRLNLWLKKLSFPDQNLVESTTDALMFLREFSHVITNNPVQVHVSALHFTPRSSTIWKNFMELPNYSPLVKSGAETHWSSTQMSLKSTTYDRCCVSFSPDGRLLAELDRSRVDVTSPVPMGTVQIWDLDGFFTVYAIKLTFNVTPFDLDRDKLNGLELVFSPDSEVLLVSHTHSVQVLNFRQKYEPDVYMLPNNIEHTTTAVAPNGSAFALGSPDNTIEIWQVTPPKLYRKAGHGCPHSLSDSGAKLLYSLPNLSDSSCERMLKCWHADTGILVDIIPDSGGIPSLSANGMFILLLSEEHLSVHDSNTGSLLFQKQFSERVDPWTTLRDAALSPDSNHLALAVVEEELRVSWIYIIEMKSGRLKAAYPGRGPLAWSPSGTILVFQDPDGNIFLLAQSTNGDMLLTFSGHESDATAVHFVVSPDTHLLVQCIAKGEISLLTLTSHTKSGTPQLRFSTDGPVFTEKNGEISLLGMPSGPSPLDSVVDYISESKNHLQLTASAISSNGCLIAMLSDAGLIAIYDADMGEQKGTLQTRLTNANYIQFASDGNFVAVTYKPTSVSRLTLSQTGGRQSEIWNTVSQRVVYHSNVYQILRFYPNGHNLVCGSFFKAQDIKTLDLDVANVRGSQVALSFDAIRIHPTLAFSTEPDAHRVAGIELDHGSVYVWDTKQLLRPGRVDIPQCYEGAPLTELALSADGRTLAAASLNCILIWILESDSDSLLPTLVAHESFAYPRPHYPVFSPNSQILTYNSEYAIKLWDVTKSQFLTPFGGRLHPDILEWHGNHHCAVGQNCRDRCLYRARDMTGFPDVVEHSGDWRCIAADGRTGLFSQPGLEVYIPSYKLPIGPILLRLNESRATVSWYWIQKDGRLVLLELPTP